MSIFNKINKLYKDYTNKDIKVIASGNFVSSYSKSEFEEIPESFGGAKKGSVLAAMSDKQGDTDYFKLGLEYLRQKKYELAAEAFETVLETRPDSVKARMHLGMAYLGMESYEAAVIELRRASLAEPANLEIKLNLCTAYIKTDKTEQAVKDLLALLKAEPDNEKIKKEIIECLLCKR